MVRTRVQQNRVHRQRNGSIRKSDTRSARRHHGERLLGATRQPLHIISGHEGASAAGGIVAAAGMRGLRATLAAAGAAIGSGSRGATASAHATGAASRCAAGSGTRTGAACSSAGAATRSSAGSSASTTCSTTTTLRVGEPDRRTGKQRTHGHRENCLSHVSAPFEVVPIKRRRARTFLNAADERPAIRQERCRIALG